MTLTFEDLPKAVAALQESVNNIEQLLLKKSEEPISEKDALLTVKEAADFLRLSVPTIYGLTAQRQIPFMKKGKRLYFSKLEIMAYLKQGRQKTLTETAKAAEEYINGKKKGS